MVSSRREIYNKEKNMTHNVPWIARFKRSLKLLAKNFKRGFGLRDADISCIPRIDQTIKTPIIRDPHAQYDGPAAPMRTREPPPPANPPKLT
jgi:hypothetical protein